MAQDQRTSTRTRFVHAGPRDRAWRHEWRPLITQLWECGLGFMRTVTTGTSLVGGEPRVELVCGLTCPAGPRSTRTYVRTRGNVPNPGIRINLLASSAAPCPSVNLVVGYFPRQTAGAAAAFRCRNVTRGRRSSVHRFVNSEDGCTCTHA
jgi:hypothetical protein